MSGRGPDRTSFTHLHPEAKHHEHGHRNTGEPEFPLFLTLWRRIHKDESERLGWKRHVGRSYMAHDIVVLAMLGIYDSVGVLIHEVITELRVKPAERTKVKEIHVWR